MDDKARADEIRENFRYLSQVRNPFDSAHLLETALHWECLKAQLAHERDLLIQNSRVVLAQYEGDCTGFLCAAQVNTTTPDGDNLERRGRHYEELLCERVFFTNAFTPCPDRA